MMKLLFSSFIFFICSIAFSQSFNDNIILNQVSSKYPSFNMKFYKGLVGDGHSNIYMHALDGIPSAPLPTKNGQLLGSLIFSGYDGSSNVQIGRIQVATTGDFSPSSYPAKMYFTLGGTTTCCGITRMAIDGTTGNVGIGTSDPVAKLHISDTNLLTGNVGDFQILSRLQGRSSNQFMENKWLLRDTNGTDWLRTRLHNAISIDASFLTPGVDTKTWWERDPWDNIQSWGNSSETYMSLVKGNLGIGTTTPDSKLTVAGNIHSREVKVTVNAGADFVFDEEYSLPTLEEVQEFIKENGHLPEIASAKDMEENGIHLSEMNIKLLQKIEELTLYTIEQEKKLKKVEDIENKVVKLEKLVEQIINNK